MLQCVFLCQCHEYIFFHFLTVKLKNTYFDFAHYCKSNASWEQQGNLYSPQYNRINFCLYFDGLWNRPKKGKHTPSTTHPSCKQRQVCNSYSAIKRKARLVKKIEHVHMEFFDCFKSLCCVHLIFQSAGACTAFQYLTFGMCGK